MFVICSEAEILIPAIFNFLVHLAEEKNHSKPVISMPKIIQLCDGLMASGQNPVTHSKLYYYYNFIRKSMLIIS